MARFESRVLTTELELEALAPEWERLRRELAEPWIEQHPAWLAAEGRASAGLMVVVLREGGQVRSIAPFLLRRWNWPCRIGYTTVAAFPMLVARLAGDALLGSCDPAVQEALLDAVATAPIPYHT
ncbi:MAG: hypothetical protein WCI05_07300, partial [Myxococcales bacterium]